MILYVTCIIMDGNGRWGLKNKNSRNAGHKAGLKTVEKIIKDQLKIKLNTLHYMHFLLKTGKDQKKKLIIYLIYLRNFKNKIKELHKQNIKLKIIGKKNFSQKLNILLRKSEIKTLKNNKLQINLALNYGSKSELISSFKSIIKKKLKINEKNISRNLQTKEIPDPDILIRTGNTKRLSNFLLWQLAYSEIFFEKKLWPEFGVKDYKKIINKFKKIKRNYGNI